MTDQPAIELNNGVRIPQLGFGTFQVDSDETQRIVETALEAGYRHIDTAAGYYNEDGVGAALKASGLARDDVFLTTKLRNGDQGHDSALAAFEASRKALDVDVVDLYLIHWPTPTRWLAPETWRAFEKLLADGGVRAIGVSNFLPHHLGRLLETAEVTPAVNQFEIHPTHQQPAVQDASRAAGIAVEAYAPIGKGEDLSEEAVEAIAQAHDVSPAQVVIRWHLQQGRIVIPKSATPERIRSNIDVFGFELTTGELDALTGLERANRLFPNPDEFEASQFRD
ncbi:aldo/keto reductase [Propioniciclava soli]|uniref:aldo/keto reductase n=1 Tax=Propioniciclava soli TaxID=2775081 RepID=UPI001E57C4A7|nr:aldo/keto reductase [Propioniciclava soli]